MKEHADELPPVKEKLMRYWGIFKDENLSAEEIDRIVEEETENLLMKKLKGE